MNFFVSILFFLLVLFFVYKKNYKGQLVLIIISLMGNMFYFEIIGTRVLLFQMVTLFAIPFYILGEYKFLNKFISGIRYEYVILIFLGLLYGFILPWEDNSSLRTWSQQAWGRSIVALIRILIEILLIFYTYRIFIRNKVSNIFLINTISSVIIFTSLFALIDFLYDHQIWKLLFTDSSYSSLFDGRFIGFSHEPRSFGRLTVIPWFILLIFKLNNLKTKYLNFALVAGFFNIASSLSFSTYIIFFLGLIILTFLRISFKFSKRSLFAFLFFTTTIYASYNFISKTDYFKSGLVYRFIMLTEGKIGFQMSGEPLFFTSFEVFDRAALNFFYNNSNYIFFGTGPNLISIPSSEYLDKSAVNTFNRTLVGIPGIGLINHVSRAGLIGLVFYLMSFYKIYRFLNNYQHAKPLKEIFLITSSIYLLVGNPWIYFMIGYVIAQNELLITNKIK